MGIPDHLTCLILCIQRNLYAGQEATVRTRHGTHWFQIRKGMCHINNLRYTDDTTIMAESEEKLKSLLMKVKEESEKVGLKPNSEN